MAFAASGRDPTVPLTPATTFVLNAATKFKVAFADAFANPLQVNEAVSPQQLLMIAMFHFGYAADQVSFMVAAPLGVSVPVEILAQRATEVVGKFIGLVTCRPELSTVIERLYTRHTALLSPAFTIEDVLRFMNKRLSQVPIILASFPPLDALVVGEAAVTQSLLQFLEARLVPDTTRISELATHRLYATLTVGHAPPSVVAPPAKKVALGAGGVSGAPPPIGPGPGGSFSWSGSPILPQSLPPRCCFYHAAGKGPCGVATAGSPCPHGFSHAPFPAAVQVNRTAFGKWLREESGFRFR
jgi:hypothetical protein